MLNLTNSLDTENFDRIRTPLKFVSNIVFVSEEDYPCMHSYVYDRGGAEEERTSSASLSRMHTRWEYDVYSKACALSASEGHDALRRVLTGHILVVIVDSVVRMPPCRRIRARVSVALRRSGCRGVNGRGRAAGPRPTCPARQVCQARNGKDTEGSSSVARSLDTHKNSSLAGSSGTGVNIVSSRSRCFRPAGSGEHRWTMCLASLARLW